MTDPISLNKKRLKWPGEGSQGPNIYFRAFYNLRLRFLTVIFSSCLTIGHASIDAKKKRRKKRIDPIVFSLIPGKKNFPFLFQQCKCIHAVLLWAKLHSKIPLGKWFFKFWPKSKSRKMKICFFGAILKQYNIFCRIMIFIVHTYIMVQISSQNPPLCTNGS